MLVELPDKPPDCEMMVIVLPIHKNDLGGFKYDIEEYAKMVGRMFAREAEQIIKEYPRTHYFPEVVEARK